MELQPQRRRTPLRISDDRYTRDRSRLDLALRLIRHEARTFTIRQWTGLSDDRIRKLYRSYLCGGDAAPVSRHRGKSPRQPAFFFRNPELHFQATQLASIFVMVELLGGSTRRLEAGFRLGSLESGTRLCHAYEAYADLHSPPAISFEHAWFLLLALGRQVDLGIGHCRGCGSLVLRDLLARRSMPCPTCEPPGATRGAATACALLESAHGAT
jgi:hypothetical protein